MQEDTTLNEMGIRLKLRSTKSFYIVKNQIMKQFLKANDDWLRKCLRHLKQDWTKHGWNSTEQLLTSYPPSPPDLKESNFYLSVCAQLRTKRYLVLLPHSFRETFHKVQHAVPSFIWNSPLFADPASPASWTSGSMWWEGIISLVK